MQHKPLITDILYTKFVLGTEFYMANRQSSFLGEPLDGVSLISQMLFFFLEVQIYISIKLCTDALICTTCITDVTDAVALWHNKVLPHLLPIQRAHGVFGERFNSTLFSP